MKVHRISEAAVIDAPADRLFGILADYRVGHPAILPRRCFTGLAVEQGGYGAGTVIRVGMLVAGRKRTFRAAVSEPVPGNVLVETGLDAEVVTTFMVQPRDADGARVEIATDLPTHDGLLGMLERIFATRFLRRVYREELDLLAKYARSTPEGS